jgi:hypothetical protein
MPGNPNFETIMVVVTRNTAGKLEFSLNSSIGGPQELNFRNNGKPGFDLNFIIDDRANSGCEFLPNPQDALWVRLIDDDTPDPCAKCAMHWNQFTATGVTNNNKTLVVSNTNRRKQQFAFSMRFNVPGEPEPVLYDPIGSNQNGPRLFSNAAVYTGIAAIGLVTLAAIRFLLV